MKFLYGTLILFVSIIFASCSQQYINTNSKILLEERVKEFYSDINPQNAWNLLSKNLKKKNRNNEEEYIKHFEKNIVFKNLHFSIVTMNINGNKAKIKMKFTADDIKTGEKFDNILYDNWVFEDNNWYMDDPSRTQ